MPYRLFFEDDILRLEFSGLLTKADLLAALRETAKLEAAAAVTPHRLTDLRALQSSDNRFPEFFGVAQQRKAKQFPNAFKSAIVAVEPMHIGLARMFQTVNDHPQITIQIFPDFAAALAWVKGA